MASPFIEYKNVVNFSQNMLKITQFKELHSQWLVTLTCKIQYQLSIFFFQKAVKKNVAPKPVVRQYWHHPLQKRGGCKGIITIWLNNDIKPFMSNKKAFLMSLLPF
jgi:hypothetical protein